MYRLILVLVAFAMCLNYAIGQSDSSFVAKESNNEIKTLFGEKGSFGMYIGLDGNFGKMNNSDVVTSGAQLGWIIDHKFAIGFSGYGFASAVPLTSDFAIGTIEYQGGYGGFFMTPILFAKEPIHVSFPIHFGTGAIQHNTDYVFNQSGLYNNEGPFSQEFDIVFYAQPGVEIEANFLRYVRLSVNASYRFFRDVNLSDIQPDALNGWTAGVGVKFGRF